MYSKSRTDLKDKLLDTYGDKCACCGEKRREFLTLEHKNKDGRQHRKESNNAWLDAVNEVDFDRFEILCMNCNWSRGKYGYCPHELEREV